MIRGRVDIRGWLAGRRRRTVSSVAVSAASAGFLIAALTANGFPARHVSANDGAVWLSNNHLDYVGRYNYPISQLDLPLAPPGLTQGPANLDVLQSGTTVLMLDRGKSDLYAVNVQDGSLVKPGVVLPGSGVSQVALGGDVAAVLDPTTGRLWAASVAAQGGSSVAALDTAAKPLLQVKDAKALAVGQDGTVFVASPTELVTIPYLRGVLSTPKYAQLPEGLGDSLQITAVGDTAVVYDIAHEKVVVPSTRAEVSIPDTSSTTPGTLQQAGPSSSEVIVSTTSEVDAIDLTDGHLTQILKGGPGTPAQPVTQAGCVYAAWAGATGSLAHWCPGVPEQQAQALPSPDGQPVTAPVFRVNNGYILLNDISNGQAWTVLNKPTLVLSTSDWHRIIDATHPKQDQNSQQPSADTTDQQNQKPKAVDDQLNARPGRTTLLHVLDNDTDPSGSVLSIASVSPATGPGYSVDVSPDTQTLSIALASDASVPVHFQYTIVDAHGQTATATVTVTPTHAETAPHLRPGFIAPVRSIASGATASYQVLGDWRDDEGDALGLFDASVPNGTISWTGDGLITYTAPVVTQDTPVTISYHVTDGVLQTAGTFQMNVLGRGDLNGVPAIANPDAYQVVVGRPAVFTPLVNDIPGADPLHPEATLRLAGPVGAATGLTVNTNLAKGQLTVTANQAGIYSLGYQDAFGSTSVAQGQILVVARDPSSSALSPVTTPVSVLLHGQYPSSVDVLAGDYDPSGGLLTVLGATAPDGYDVTVVEGQYLRVVATLPNPPAQSIVTYQVTNGITDPVNGQLTVDWTKPLQPAPAPVATPVNALVRAGDEADVPVLASDSDPGGEPIYLIPGSVTVSPAGAGKASIAGSYLRYAAPPASSVTSEQTVDVSYIVENQSGESTTGHVTFTVNPKLADAAATDSAPNPTEVDTRTAAGGTITINIPTSGVDPDGDSVAVTGIIDPPQLGRVTAISPSSITYESYPLSAGTDSFTYQVEDQFGLSGQATIRVAVDPPSQTQPPVAVPVFVTGAPGSHTLVNVIASDIVAPGDAVTIEPLAKTNTPVPGGFSLIDNAISVTAPAAGQTRQVTYGVADGSSTASTSQVTVRSESGYVDPPVAVDDYPPRPAQGQTSVLVHVLANDFDPSGTPSGLSIVGVSESDVQVLGQVLRIPLQTNPRDVAYEIRNSQGGTAVGVVHVPGLVAPAQLKASAGVIRVPHDGSVTVDINNYISDSRGPVRLVSASGVFTTPASGLEWHPSSYTTLTLSDLGGYTGPGDLTVQVTDGKSSSDPHGQVSVVSLPVQVGPPTPVVRCPAAPVTLIEGGAAVDLTLASQCQVWTPVAGQAASLSFSASWAAPIPGVAMSWKDSRRVLVLAASSSADQGTGKIHLTVPGTTAASELNVAVERPPQATVSAINVPGVKTGQTATVDLKQYVTSRLAQPVIQVISAAVASGGQATVSKNGSVVQITPQPGTHGTLTISVQVTDLPGRLDRTVPASIVLQVLDAPGAPAQLQGVVGNQQVALSWPAAADNGAAIDYYTVTASGGPGQGTQKVPGTSYNWIGLQNGVNYQFTVRAHNLVGDSTSAVSQTFMPQSVPGTPGAVTATPGDGQVDLSWGAANPNGQPVTYEVSVTPAPKSGPASQQTTGTGMTWSGFDNNIGPYTFTVTPDNKLGPGPSAQSSPVYTHGTPQTPPAPTASGAVSPDQTTTTITVSWPAITQCNDARPCASYIITELRNGSVLQTVTSTGSTCSGSSSLCVSFGPITNDGSKYTYELQATNTEGQTSTPSPPSSPAVDAVGIPGQITDLKVTPQNQSIQAQFTLPPSHGASITKVNYQASNANGPSVSGSWSNPGASGTAVTETIPGLVNGDNYTVTVEACNEANECGSASNSASASPYGPPFTPSVSATPSGNSVTFSWSGGYNGRPITYTVCTTQNPCTSYSSAGSATYNYACSQTVTISAYVTDSLGEKSGTASASATTAACPPPAPYITAVRGDPGSISGCSSSCYWVSFQVHNFPTGTYYWQCYSDPAGDTTPPGTLSYDSSTTTPTHTITITSANESFSGGSGSSGYCIYDPYVYTYAIDINGVESNFAQ